jgi:ubiquitin carboxyl-terminal hydrolase 25/28
MQELKHLFQQMITANSDRVRPDLKLAALALTKADLTKPDKPTENSAQEEGPQPALGHIEGLPVAGPAPYQSPTHPISHIDGAPIDDLVLDDAGIHGSNPSSTAVEAGTDGDQEMADAMTENPADTPNPAEPPARPPPAVPPRPLDLKKIEGLAQQQDAAEILNNIFDLLSCAIRAEDTIENGEQMDLIKKLFFSEVTTVHYMGGETTSVTSLKDHHLVSPGNRDRPLTAALDDDLGFEDFESAKGDVITKFEYLARAPPILIINVRRLLYEKGQPKLDTSRLGLDDVLYLDRYLKRTASLTEDELQHLRKNQWQLQLQLQSLMSRKGLLQVTDEKLSLPDAVDETADLIEDVNQHSDEVHVDQEENTIPVYTELPAALRSRADELRKELDDIDGHIQQLDREVGAVFEQYRDHPYRLHAVFMHRGGAKGGHYWIYIHDSQNKVWRSYNDETVEEVDAREIFERSDSATSTGIVYVRDNEINELTEPLCRRPPSEMTGTANKQSGETVPVIQGIPME